MTNDLPLDNLPPNHGLRIRQPWEHLRSFTSARIALGRSGGSQTTPTVLDFRLSHARARDAVHAEFSESFVCEKLAALGHDSLVLRTAVRSRKEYLLRPDLGRRLSEESARLLASKAPEWQPCDLAIIISDGLAARAALDHAVPTADGILRAARTFGWHTCPVLVVPFARVKVQDEIGSILQARQTLILLGERPGLGTPDSLGAYFTYAPSSDKTDADRNCVSNIRPQGLAPEAAAKKIAALLLKSVEAKSSGYLLKDAGETLALPDNP